MGRPAGWIPPIKVSVKIGPAQPIRGSSTRTLPKAPFVIFAVPNTCRRVPVAGPTAAFSTSRPPWLGAPCDACIKC